jgi:hypothetical protein
MAKLAEGHPVARTTDAMWPFKSRCGRLGFVY